MKKVCILLISVILSLTAEAQKISPITVCDSLRAFESGEKLTMTIQYKCLGIRSDVGYATLSLCEDKPMDGRRIFRAEARGWTASFFDKFFKVRDLYSAKFFADNGHPIWFHRNVYEGGYSLTNDFIWDVDGDIINVCCQYLSSGRIKDTVMTSDNTTYDAISILYAARNIDFNKLSPGTVFPYTFVIDEEKYDIYFRYDGKETKKLPQLGTFNTLKIAIKVIEGEVFSGDYEIFLYVSDDRNHLPLWIESPIIVGSVVGRLTAYENIVHPLTSKINQ